MIRTTVLVALATLALPAAAEDVDHLAELEGLRALHAWTRATDAAETLVFVEIENEGEETVILEGARGGTLVGFRLVDGEEVYEPVPSVPVSPGRSLHLEPGGLALRMTGLDRPLEKGAEMDLELLTSLGTMDVHVEVEATDATTHSHAGHNH